MFPVDGQNGKGLREALFRHGGAYQIRTESATLLNCSIWLKFM
jgi:hypothetical protein